MSGNIDGQTEEVLGRTGGDRPVPSVADALEEAGLEGASDVLVLGPLHRSTDDEVCAALLERAAVADGNVLCVSFTRPAEERLGVLRDRLDRLPERVAVVSCADRHPSETTVRTADGTTRVSVEVVSDPSDLPRLGTTVSRAVSEWDPDAETLLCFHSLTALLQYADTQRAFRFLHLMRNRLDTTNHYHMDSEAHDGQTVASLRPLFDAVVEYDHDGDVTVTD